MPFLFIIIEIFLLAIKLLIGFCKMKKGAVFERGSHLQSLKPPEHSFGLPRVWHNLTQPRASEKLLVHSERDIFHRLQAGQWLHQPPKAVTHMSLHAPCALLSLPAKSGGMVLGCHGWKQAKPQLWPGQSAPGIPPPSQSCSCCLVTDFHEGLML